MERQNLIVKLSFEFAVRIVHLCKTLADNKEYIISKQLQRSAISVGANIEEALAGHSKRDFAFKMSIAAKEARETRYWLRLLHESQVVQYDYNVFLADIEVIVRILTSIVKTTQGNLKSAR